MVRKEGEPIVFGTLHIVAIGIPLAFNLLHVCERMAAFARPLPWFLKGIGSDYPITYRFVGVVAVVMGGGLVIGGIATGGIVP